MPLPELALDEAMTYLRVTISENDEEVSMTLYEVDPGGWVHRQCQMRSDGLHFAPEDILMCSRVNLPAMLAHPCTDELDEDDFELLWTELATERSFLHRVPDPRRCWEGTMQWNGRIIVMRWQPHGDLGLAWSRVPGFAGLYVHGSTAEARSTCSAVFLDEAIEWRAVGSTGSRIRMWEAA